MSTPAAGPNPVDLAFQLATGYMASSCISAVTRLGIPDLLEKGPTNVAELARATSTSEDILYRVLRALSSAGLFAEPSPRTFTNTPASDVLRANAQFSIRDMVIWIADPFHFDVYREMMPTLRDGKNAIEHIYQKPPFDVIFSDPDRARVFNNAMSTMSAIVIPAVLEVYDFSDIGTLADIAGGHGVVLTSILQKYPNMKGILFDLRHVLEGARDRIQKVNLSNRIQTVAGDFFEDVPAADAYIMKHIIHDWDDERALKILSNCARHLKKGGKVILLETVVAAGSEPHLGKWIDIEMFMMPGGRERTESEFRELFARVGLRLSRVVPTQSPLSVVEAQKA